MRKLWIVLSLVLLIPAAGVAKQPVSALALGPEAYMSEASKWARLFLTRAHYKQTRLDDTLSAEIWEQYLDTLDPNRSYFLKRDINAFEPYRESLDESLENQNLAPAYDIFNLYRQRVEERAEHAKELLDQDFDFTIDESYRVDRSGAEWAASRQELDEIWRKRVKLDVLRLKLEESTPEEIKETLTRRYDNMSERVAELNSEDVFQFFMNSFATAIEPHTGYLAPRTSENFRIAMRLSLEGIGAVLQRENEHTVVRRVVPGGPADKDGRLAVGDRILGVGQGDAGELTNVVGWRLDDVVDMIRGPKGTKVRIEVLPAAEGLSGQASMINITRNEVKLEEQAAKKSVFEIGRDGQSFRIGVIDLPAFYHDFAGQAARKPDYRSSTRDVRKLLEELKGEGVDGVLIDLRNNGGGSLDEATELTGLFIDRGPVVQVRDRSGGVEVQRDVDAGVVYDGPLGVLVNRHSASASEIFAAAIQDYGRGVIIGESTFGKGTVQNLIDLDRHRGGDDGGYGQLKLTIAQFFRINGGSTQHRGVIPDVVFPTLTPSGDYGESSFDNALPWSSIDPARYDLAGDLSAVLPTVAARTEKRLEDNLYFKLLLDDMREFEKMREKKEVSLLESVHLAERAQSEQRRESRDALLEEWTGIEDVAQIGDDLVDSVFDGMDEEGDNAAVELPDVLLNEAVRVVSDLAELSEARSQSRVAKAGPKPVTEI